MRCGRRSFPVDLIARRKKKQILRFAKDDKRGGLMTAVEHWH
jgi:hypothetical protein